MKTLLLSRKEVELVLDMDSVIEAVEEAYRVYQLGNVDQPPIQTVYMEEHRGDVDIKTCYNRKSERYSIKTVSLFEENGKGAYEDRTADGKPLPNMLGTVILGDGRTGAVQAILESGLITAIRTGAAGAVSCKYLARKNSSVSAILGAGLQGRMQAYAIARVREIRQFRVFDRIAGKEQLEAYREDVERKTGVPVYLCSSVTDAVNGADIVVCPTPAREAYLRPEHIRPGMHIVEIGVDMDGKAEVTPAAVAMADKIVCDSLQQCIVRGEIGNAIRAGAITQEDVSAEIGEVVLGLKSGRQSEEEITFFDSTGMGIQDNTTAEICYKRAVEKGLGRWFEFI